MESYDSVDDILEKNTEEQETESLYAGFEEMSKRVKEEKNMRGGISYSESEDSELPINNNKSISNGGDALAQLFDNIEKSTEQAELDENFELEKVKMLNDMKSLKALLAQSQDSIKQELKEAKSKEISMTDEMEKLKNELEEVYEELLKQEARAEAAENNANEVSANMSALVEKHENEKVTLIEEEQGILKQAEKELEEATKTIAKMKKDLDDARYKLENEIRLAADERGLAVLREDKIAKRAEVAEQAQKNALKLANGSKEQIEQASNELNAAKKENKEAWDLVDVLKKEKKEALEKINLLEIEKDEALEKLAFISDDKEEALIKFTVFEGEKKEILQQFDALEAEKNDALKLVDTLEAEKKDNLKRIDLLEVEKRDALRKVDALEEEKKEALDEVDVLEEEKKEALEKVDALEVEKQDMLLKLENTLKTTSEDFMTPNKNDGASIENELSVEIPIEQHQHTQISHKEDKKNLARIIKLKQRLVERAGVDSIAYNIGFSIEEPISSPQKDSKPPSSTVKRNQKETFINSFVSYFNDQVDDVFYKDQLALLLAKELLEHHGFKKKRDAMYEKLKKEKNHRHDVRDHDELEVLDIEIETRQENLRGLSNALGIVVEQSPKNANVNRIHERAYIADSIKRSFLSNERFKSISIGMTHLSSAQHACKVLLGLLIQERKKSIPEKPESILTDEFMTILSPEKDDITIDPLSLQSLYTSLSINASDSKSFDSSAKSDERKDQNVFSRLTNPQSFTGTQKLKKDQRKLSYNISANSPMRMRSVQGISNASPMRPSSRNKNTRIHGQAQPSPKRSISRSRNNYHRGGTPQASPMRPYNATDSSSGSASHYRSLSPFTSLQESISPKNSEEYLKSSRREWVAHYTEKNVFERLQNTKTTSYAKKSRK